MSDSSVTVCRRCRKPENEHWGAKRYCLARCGKTLTIMDDKFELLAEPAPAERPRVCENCGKPWAEHFADSMSGDGAAEVFCDKDSHARRWKAKSVAASPEGPRQCHHQYMLRSVCSQCGDFFDGRPAAMYAASHPSLDAAKESSIERQIAICEQNGAKWCNFAVADVKRLLVRPDAAKGVTPMTLTSEGENHGNRRIQVTTGITSQTADKHSGAATHGGNEMPTVSAQGSNAEGPTVSRLADSESVRLLQVREVERVSSPDAAKVEEIAAEIAYAIYDHDRGEVAKDLRQTVTDEWEPLIAAILRPYFPQVSAAPQKVVYFATCPKCSETQECAAPSTPSPAPGNPYGDNRMLCAECHEPVCDHIAEKLMPSLISHRQPTEQEIQRGMDLIGDAREALERNKEGAGLAGEATEGSRFMVSKGGEIHEYCPDCRGECSPYKYAPAAPEGAAPPELKLTKDNIEFLRELEREGQHRKWTTMESVHVHQGLDNLLTDNEVLQRAVAEVRELRASVEFLERELNNFRRNSQHSVELLEQTQAQLRTAREALRKYAVHFTSCAALKGNPTDMRWPDHPRCDCGLRKAVPSSTNTQSSGNGK